MRNVTLIIAKGLSANSGLKRFGIGWNGLAQDGAKAFFKVLKDNECLEELDLSNNRIATEGAVYIAKGLSANTALKSIKMAMNPMESAGCFSIIKGRLFGGTERIQKGVQYTSVDLFCICSSQSGSTNIK